jgi:hypothetical protein
VTLRRAAVAALALAAAGCAGHGPGEASGAGYAVSAFINACAQDRPELAAELLTPLARGTFIRQGRNGCFASIGLRPGTAADLRRTRVVRVVADGGETLATVTVRGPDGATHAVDAVGRGSLWQLAGVNGG